MQRCRNYFFSVVGFVAVAVSIPRAAEVEFGRVAGQWREAESFDRISEYFGGGENRGGQVVVRTHADLRPGYYFLVRVSDASALTGAKFELSVIRPDAPEAKTFTLPAEAHKGGTVFVLGLTGTDWPGGGKANPVAWKLTLLAADGHPLAEQKSFLWEKPAK